MSKVVKDKRENISGTIGSEYKKWLLETSKREKIPSSHLLEQGIILLKKYREDESKTKIEKEIEKGINIMLSEKEDYMLLDGGDLDTKLGEELL